VKLLLDTHIWLWTQLDPDRLTSRVRQTILKAEEVWLSSISVWEFLLLVEKKRIVLNQAPRAWLERAGATSPIKQAALTHEVAMHSRSIQVPHQDPADRFIAATAQVLRPVQPSDCLTLPRQPPSFRGSTHPAQADAPIHPAHIACASI